MSDESKDLKHIDTKVKEDRLRLRAKMIEILYREPNATNYRAIDQLLNSIANELGQAPIFDPIQAKVRDYEGMTAEELHAELEKAIQEQR